MTRPQPKKSAKPIADGKSKGNTEFATGDVILAVGLGNPGISYAGHRHNIGFMALDAAADAHKFGAWRSKFQGEIAEGRIAGKRVILLKPMTFMNESGRSVGEAARFLKVPPEDVIVIHDELDLAPGKCRVKTGGGHAGHNGLRSIHAHIGADYARVRLGIGHPGNKNLVSGYVLHDFPKSENALLRDLLDGISDGFPALIAGDGGKFQNAVALRTKPPKPSSATKAPYAARRAANAQKEARDKAEKSLEQTSPASPLARLIAKFSR